MKLSKILFFSFVFILPFVTFSFFLNSSLYFNLLKRQNGPSYFYLSYDWMKKTQLAINLSNETTTLFFGSSRTAYALDQKVSSPELLNLSLMAASYNEMELLAQAMAANHVKAKKIYLELNPTSATARHIRAMAAQSSEDIFGPYLNISAISFIERQLHKTSLYLNHSILRDSFSQFFLNPNDNFDSYKKMKRSEHVKEFQEMNSTSYRGFISSMKDSSEYHQRAFAECSTMLNWIMSKDQKDDLHSGMKKFNLLIFYLKQISSEVLVWIPPSPPGKQYAEREELIIKELQSAALKQNLKIVDLRTKLNLTDNDYFDCVHPNARGAHIISEFLLKK